MWYQLDMKEKWLSESHYSVPFEAGVEKYSFFDVEKAAFSKEDLFIAEQEATRFLVDRFEPQLKALCGFDPCGACLQREVANPFTHRRRKPGDIDILIYNPKNLSRVVAAEIKIVRKRQVDSANDFVVCLERIKKGIEQADGLLDIGFGGVFLIVIMLANVSNQNDFNLLCRSIEPMNWEKVRKYFFQCRRSRPIGLINIEIDQTSAKRIHEAGSISGYTAESHFREQDVHLTETVQNWLKTR